MGHKPQSLHDPQMCQNRWKRIVFKPHLLHQDYAAKINASADDLGYDLKNNPADFKKLKEKSREIILEI